MHNVRFIMIFVLNFFIIPARSDADKMARQAQLLWAASEALEGVLRGRGPKAARVSVATELEAIATAAGMSNTSA